MATNGFFPTIGSVVQKAEALPDDPEASKPIQDAFDEERPLQEMESLCMSCHEQGTTRMMLTSIPYFREVIVMSFKCDHCGAQNSEIQSAGAIQAHGVIYTVKIINVGDLNRQLVKSRYCTITIPEYEITIPPSRGQLTTIEGLLRGMVADLNGDQPLRRIQDPDTYEKIEAILNKLRAIVPDEDDEDDSEASKPSRTRDDHDAPVPNFTLIAQDPSGNSFVEFLESITDPRWKMKEYQRNREENIAVGMITADEADEPVRTTIPEATEVEKDEVLVFLGQCSSCSRPCDTRMKQVNIPYFKDIIIMSTNCEACGYKDNEVKSSGAISDKGKRITLKVQDEEDLSRDILKSDTCGLEIPEIQLILNSGTLGGRFTTVEGILTEIYEQLSGRLFGSGDAIGDHDTLHRFLNRLQGIKSGAEPFTLILDDPVANSYLQNLYAPDPDPNMTIELYERTAEQNDDLGLTHMKLEGYENDATEDAKKEEKDSL